MVEHTAVEPPRKARYRRSEALHWDIPIVDRNRRIVGWTKESPLSFGQSFRHAAAETLTRGPVTCAYVQIADHRAAERAGAPVDWPGPWRCIAIVAENATGGGHHNSAAPLLDIAP